MLAIVGLYILFFKNNELLKDNGIYWLPKQNPCIPYKDVMKSDGFCEEHLHDKFISITPARAKQIDASMKSFFVDNLAYEFTKKDIIKSEYLTFLEGLISKECDTNTTLKIMKILSTLPATEKSLKESLQCSIDIKWFLCHFYYITCSVDLKSKNRISSPPCLEEVQYAINKNYCKELFYFVTKMQQVHDLCPSFFAGKRMNFTAYPRSNIKYLEKCQKQGKTSNALAWFTSSTADCYNGNGLHYTGTLHTARSGKSCSYWNENPFINNVSYSTLQENYCRNPQSYGKKPWCYTNMKSRDWEYCDVTKCRELKDSGHSLTETELYIIAAVSCLAISSLLFTMYVILRNGKGLFSSKEDEEIAFYDKTYFDEENIRKIIDETMDDNHDKRLLTPFHSVSDDEKATSF